MRESSINIQIPTLLQILKWVFYIFGITKASHNVCEASSLFQNNKFIYNNQKNFLAQTTMIIIDTAMQVIATFRSCFCFSMSCLFTIQFPFYLHSKKSREIEIFLIRCEVNTKNVLYLTYTIEWNLPF